MEIKIRAWDKGNQRMIYPSGAYTSGTILNRWDDENIMLCTGLTDKLGKDIYEGDILNFLWDKKAEGGGYICGSRGFQKENEAEVYFENGEFKLEGHGNLYEKISFNQSGLGWTVVGCKFDECRAVVRAACI